MPNYQNGKIYKIVSNLTDKIYIGSTTMTLSQRMGGHRKDYKNKNKNVSSSILLDYGDAKIILIKKYPCDGKNNLEAEERVYIETMTCVNKNIPTRTKSEWYQDNKEHKIDYQRTYNHNNTEHLKEYRKQYYLDNKETKREYRKTEYHDNKEHKLDYQRTYNQDNKEQIKQYNQENKELIANKKRHYWYWYNNKRLFGIIKPLFDDI